MKKPENYLEWSSFFDEASNAPMNEEFIDLAAAGSISWSSGVAERFIRSASEMIRKRVNRAQDAYQRQMKNAGGSTGTLTMALKSLSKEYRFVYQLAKALPIPDNYRDQLADSIRSQAEQTQQSLMDSAKADRTGHLMSIVRNTRLDRLD